LRGAESHSFLLFVQAQRLGLDSLSVNLWLVDCLKESRWLALHV